MQPLAERLRPQTLDEYIGQKHLVGEGAVIRRMIEQKRVSSFILWGPPGVGKTTLAGIIAKTLEVPFFTLSAVTSGVKDVREVIEKAKASSFFGNVRGGVSPILFIDEIHRFSTETVSSIGLFSYLSNKSLMQSPMCGNSLVTVSNSQLQRAL